MYRPIARALFRSAVLAAALSALAGCASYPPAPDAAPVPDGVAVRETSDSIVLLPRAASGDTGFLFYPGALVSPKAYVPMLSALAASGVPAIIAKMPYDLAVLDRDAAVRLIAGSGLPVRSWVIGGHSLGGAMAASLSRDRPDLFRGLVLLAAYPPEDKSLAVSGVPVLSLSASRDGLATPEKGERFRPLLPASTRFVRIEGGNHAQFGSYGPQSGDGTAEIPRAEQHRIVAEEVLSFLEDLSR